MIYGCGCAAGAVEFGKAVRSGPVRTETIPLPHGFRTGSAWVPHGFPSICRPGRGLIGSSCWPLPVLAGTVPATRWVPVALEQLNLKLPPAGPETGPPGRGTLADRLTQLERSTADLAAAQLQAQGPAPRSSDACRG